MLLKLLQLRISQANLSQNACTLAPVILELNSTLKVPYNYVPALAHDSAKNWGGVYTIRAHVGQEQVFSWLLRAACTSLEPS